MSGSPNLPFRSFVSLMLRDSGERGGGNSNKGTTIETEKRVPIGVAFLGVFTHVKMKDTQKVGS